VLQDTRGGGRAPHRRVAARRPRAGRRAGGRPGSAGTHRASP
jgi:hypothetical protein